MDVSQAPVLELKGIDKSFGDNRVLKEVNLTLRSHEMLALAGENGAGKSTIVKLLSGIHSPNAGEILIDGVVVEISSPKHAAKHGIRVVHQEPTLFPDLDVAENIFIGRQPRNGIYGISWSGMYRQASDLISDLLHFEIDPREKVSSLSIAERQVVEIVKALALDAKILILDEPTAALTAAESADLFRVVDRLKAKGVAVLFIGHRLDEIEEHADQLAVLRDGGVVASASPKELTREQIIASMVGRELSDLYPKRPATLGDVVMEVTALTRAGALHDVTFSVREGEILGFAGLVGAGRTEIARAIFGIDRVDSGSISISGKSFVRRRPSRAMKRGIALVPEDRQGQGLVLTWSVEKNSSLSIIDRISRLGLIRGGAERQLADETVAAQAVKTTSVLQEVSSLSGGNQQKVVLGKWLATEPVVLILDEPTRGVDIQTKAEIHRQISDLAQGGLAVILISSELPEVMGMSDRILVMCEGRIAEEFDAHEATQEKIMAAATNSTR